MKIQEKTRAELLASFTANRAEVQALPDAGNVFQWDNGLCVKIHGRGQIAVVGIAGATVMDTLDDDDKRWMDFSNGLGEPAIYRPMIEAKAIVLAHIDATIALVEGAA